MTNWYSYYNLTKDNPPSLSLKRAFHHVENKDTSLDLGCGAFRDTKFLLKHFKNVVAMDKEMPPLGDVLIKNLKFYRRPFQDFHFEEYDLINAQYSLPFMPKKDFLEVWPKLVKSLKPGGIFVGQLFGVEDEWAKNIGMAFFTFSEVKKLCKSLEAVEFIEEKKQGTLANGTLKHWHLFHLILKK